MLFRGASLRHPSGWVLVTAFLWSIRGIRNHLLGRKVVFFVRWEPFWYLAIEADWIIL